MRIAITGLPGTGKTFVAGLLSKYLQLEVQHTDVLRDLPWTEQPIAALDRLPTEGIIEGVTVSRMLTRGFTPDVLIYLEGAGKGVRSMPWIETNVRLYERSKVGRVVRLHQRPDDVTLLYELGKVVELRPSA